VQKKEYMDIAYKNLIVFNCSYKLVSTLRFASVLKPNTYEYLNPETNTETSPHIKRWSPKGFGPSKNKTAESDSCTDMISFYDALC
jgi:hypothetical protein